MSKSSDMMKEVGSITTDDILEMLLTPEKSRPYMRAIFGIASEYAKELEAPLVALTDWRTDRRIATIKRYEAAGFTRQESILMTLDSIAASNNSLANYRHTAASTAVLAKK